MVPSQFALKIAAEGVGSFNPPPLSRPSSQQHCGTKAVSHGALRASPQQSRRSEAVNSLPISEKLQIPHFVRDDNLFEFSNQSLRTQFGYGIRVSPGSVLTRSL
jgi:hypothetical protein